MATVVIEREAREQFHDLPVTIRNRIEKLFARLEKWPEVSGAKALTGNLAGHYRVRTGDYRVQFRVVQIGAIKGGSRSDQVIIEKVGHRDRFYED